MSREQRRQQLAELMERLALGAILLKRPANFAWYTGGADNRVDHSAPLGVAGVVVTRDSEYVITDNIEFARMREEQTPGLEVVEHPWYEDGIASLRELTGDAPLGVDFHLEGAYEVSDEVAPLRYVLDADTIDRYRHVGADAAAAMREAAEALDPEMSELEAVANLLAACCRRGLYSPVAFAAGERRVVRYRHAIPQEGRLGRRAMLVVCAERGGLYANLSRFVHFEEPDRNLKKRFDACETILRRMREEATRPGRTMAEAFADCQRFYAEAGFPEEWKLHHQGGLTGYASREVVATPETAERIRVSQAFAWNPSVTGAKAEETFVLTSSGSEVVTRI